MIEHFAWKKKLEEMKQNKAYLNIALVHKYLLGFVTQYSYLQSRHFIRWDPWNKKHGIQVLNCVVKIYVLPILMSNKSEKTLAPAKMDWMSWLADIFIKPITPNFVNNIYSTQSFRLCYVSLIPYNWPDHNPSFLQTALRWYQENSLH